MRIKLISKLPFSWIESRETISWPARSADLAPVELLLLGYMKRSEQDCIHQFNTVEKINNVTYYKYTNRYGSKCTAKHVKSIFFCLKLKRQTY